MIERSVLANPATDCPPAILVQQVAVPITHYDFEGRECHGTIEVNATVAADVRAFFELAYQLKFPIQRVVPASDPEFGWDDDKLMATNASSGFNYRLIGGTDRPSLHGLGRAIDVNPMLNPMISYRAGEAVVSPPSAVHDVTRPGTFTADHALVKLMIGRGWEWGGNWTPESGRTDYHHFQKAI